MHIQDLQTSNQQIDSDSSEHSDDDLDNFMKEKLRSQSKEINSRSSQPLSIGFKTCIAVYLLLVAIILFLYLNSSFNNTNNQKTKNGQSRDHLVQTQSLIHSNNMDPITLHDIKQKDMKNNQQSSQTKESTPMLQAYGYSYQRYNAMFSAKPLSTQRNPLRVTEHWLVKQKPYCIPQTVVNSATRLTEDSFAQATAYQNLNIISAKVSIPAEKLYYFQGARQFIENISILTPNTTVIYDHYSPLLLILTIRCFQQGIFVSDRNNWPLLQKNLVFNDVYPLANVYSHDKIVTSQAYKILITHDFSLAIDLIVKQKKDIIVLIDCTHPISVKTAFLLKIKLYKLQEALQCSTRSMILFQEAIWHIEQEVFIVPGWYVLTNSNNQVTFGTQHFNYEQPLINENKLSCRPLKAQQLKHSYFLANKIHIMQLPYSSLYWFGKETEKPVDYYQQVHGFLSQTNAYSSVYLDSGPVVFLLVAVASLPKSTKMFLNKQYSNKKTLMKLLVLNSQEKVKIAENQQEIRQKFDLTLTDKHESLMMINSTKYILFNEKEKQVYPSMKYSQIIEQGCRLPKINQVTNQVVSKGVYLIESKQ